MKKLAMIDLDGTLFDTNEVNYFAYKMALNEKGFSLDYEYYKKECNGRYYKEFLPSIVNNDEEIMEYVHKRKKELYEKFLDKAIPNEHLFNILEGIKVNYYLALVTTASKKNTYDILKYFNKVELFDLILTHDDIKNSKPNPEGFIKTLEHFKVEAKDAIVFEDSEVGIEAAEKIGASIFKVEKIAFDDKQTY